MKHDYPDILALTDQAPLWYDENGTPRFLPHAPGLCPDIYVREVALLSIRCQLCGMEFKVQLSNDLFDQRQALEQQVKSKTLYYGDPPRHGGCTGNTMTSEEIQVLEFWARIDHQWVRKPDLEISLVE